MALIFPITLGICHQDSDPPYAGPLLRARRERPCSRAAEKRYELAPSHYSITSSAMASSVGGTLSPSAAAVLRLIANSNLVGCWIGRSPGFSPLRMRSTYDAACRNTSAVLAPWDMRPPFVPR